MRLVFKKRMFRDTDENITEPMFINLSYLQAKHDYLGGNYPVGKEDAVQLAAFQIQAEVRVVPVHIRPSCIALLLLK